MRGRAGLLALLVCGGGCIDSLLETGSLPKGNLSVTLAPSGVAVPQGGEQSMVATVNRVGNFDGPVAVAVSGAATGIPGGVTVEVTLGATAGRATLANILIRVAPDTPLGTYSLRVRATGVEVAEGSAPLTLTVTPKPDFSLTTSAASLAIARGGLAPVGVMLARTAFQGPVALTLTGTPGITATFTPNPAVGVVADATVSVAAGVAPGTYAMTIEGSAAGLAPRNAALSVVVLADPLQLLLAPQLSSPQAGSVSVEFILNQGPGVGAVSFTAEGLPAGVTASFTPGSQPGRRIMTLAVGPLVTPGSHLGLLRAVASGVPDATAPFTLQVTPAGVAVTLLPAAANLTAGGSATVQLLLTRTDYTGPVALAFENLPAGITVTAAPATVTALTTTLTVRATAQTAPGPAVITVRAIPVNLGPEAERTVPLALTVLAAPPGIGNVVLDATRCQLPAWVAGQDGDGAWTQLLPLGGVFRFDVAANLGAYALVRGGQVLVEYRTRAELTAGPVDLCGEVPGTKVVTGTGAHGLTTGAQWTYGLGGGSGASTTQAPAFAITGVRGGIHDLVVFPTTTAAGLRGLILRDLDPPDGSSLGTIDMSGEGSFPRAQAQLATSGGVEAGGAYSASMHYLTTAACTRNLLLDNNTSTMWGVPEEAQRPDDFHMQTIRWNTPTGAVTATEVFHRLANRTFAWPQAVSTPTVTVVPGGHQRLRAVHGNVPAIYTDRRQLQYTDGGSRTMSVAASTAHFVAAGFALTMPDLSGVAGWPAALAIPPGTGGTWTFVAEGSNGAGPLCTEGRRLVAGYRRGGYQAPRRYPAPVSRSSRSRAAPPTVRRPPCNPPAPAGVSSLDRLEEGSHSPPVNLEEMPCPPSPPTSSRAPWRCWSSRR